MSVKDFQLKGNNICNVDCMDANAILHPETNVDQLKIGLLSSKTLTDWLTFNPDNPTQPFDGFDSYNGLIPWLNHYYPRGESGSIVPATKTTIGGVVIGDNLDVTEEGTLSVDVESLNIPDEVSTASVDTEGTVKLGNGTRTPVNFSTSTIVDGDNYYQYPLRIDANNRTGIVIPQATFSQVQTDWNQTDTSSVDYIKNKPTIPTVNNSIVTVQQGGVTKSTFTLNQNSNVTVYLDSTDVPVASNSTIGGIKIGYTKEDNKKPVQLDANNMAYVDTEQHLTIGDMITNGLSAHFYRVGTGSSAGSFTQNTWIPIIMSVSNNIGKCSVEFEILGREYGKTSYGKYYVNHMTNTTNKLICLSFYSEDTNHFDYNDIRAAKYAVDNNNVTIIVYKKVRNVSDSMFIVNILAENSSTYSTQHYFYTGSSSISETGYLLTNSDFRIGTLESNTITAKLENDASSQDREMTSILADNATSYTTT